MLHRAGVTFAILGPKESCTGDPVRRLGNEYLYQEQGKLNIATLDEVGAKKIIASCPHCFNTIKNEYPALGGNYEVIHHAQLLEHLVHVGQAHPRLGLLGQGHLSRPLLPRPAQPHHRRAPDRAQRHARCRADRDAALQGARLLLRRRRRPHVARGEHRQAGQHGAHGRGPRHRCRRRLDRLPLLHDHAGRRGAGQRQGRRRARARSVPAGRGIARRLSPAGTARPERAGARAPTCRLQSSAWRCSQRRPPTPAPPCRRPARAPAAGSGARR